MFQVPTRVFKFVSRILWQTIGTETWWLWENDSTYGTHASTYEKKNLWTIHKATDLEFCKLVTKTCDDRFISLVFLFLFFSFSWSYTTLISQIPPKLRTKKYKKQKKKKTSISISHDMLLESYLALNINKHNKITFI